MENETNGGLALIRQLGSAVDSETEARLRRETQRFMKAMTQYKCAVFLEKNCSEQGGNDERS